MTAERQPTAEEIEAHLQRCDGSFVPPLSSRVSLHDYAEKLHANAKLFTEFDGDRLVALVAAYHNADEAVYFISNVSVEPAYSRRGLASTLLERCLAEARHQRAVSLVLEVNSGNTAALAFYRSRGFMLQKQQNDTLRMTLPTGGQHMETPRNYDRETHDTPQRKYAYGFDFDVMHPYMIKSFEPFFTGKRLLELGCFEGALTRRLAPYFKETVCVEASGEAILKAKEKVPSAQFLQSRFEDARLDGQFDTIVMTHVLEHLDDPVSVLKRINDEWLAPNGNFLLVCPNANAPSRQIAVKMGLISHNSAVTPAEREHGHRITYSLDTLERDARAAGLQVISRSGIFFKALANFQWDRLLQTDIVSQAYLDGCFMLGQQYPDLCASIFLACRRGTL